MPKNDKNVLDDDLLDDDVEEIDIEDEDDLDEEHDPVNAEKKSSDSVVDAGRTGPKAKARKGDKLDQENGGKPYKPNKGIVRELYSKMQEMTAADLRKLHDLLMDEDFDVDDLAGDAQDALEDVQYDMSEDIADLVESEATLSEGFKDKAGTIMEMAVKSRVKSEIARLEEAYEAQFNEELEAAQEELVSMIDGYLNHVVEEWMAENELAVQSGLRTEIAESFMNGLKDLFEESYIEVPEEKVDLVDDLAEQVEQLEEELNGSVDKMISMSEELEMYKREAIILEFADDLADTQLDKLTKLADAVDYDDEDTFRERVSTIKETYFGKKAKTNAADLYEGSDDDDEEDASHINENMSRYVSALNKSHK